MATNRILEASQMLLAKRNEEIKVLKARIRELEHHGGASVKYVVMFQRFHGTSWLCRFESFNEDEAIQQALDLSVDKPGWAIRVAAVAGIVWTTVKAR